MIEVNLLPGGKKKRSGPRLNFALPNFGGAGDLDRWAIGAGLAIVLALGGIGYTYLTTSGQIEDAELALEEQLEDSVRFEALIERTDELTARRDSILQRIAVIQEIDQGRYTWAHIMDEIARALPEYTWLIGISEVADFPDFEINIDGAAGDLTAVTTFLQRLEASPFFRDVRFTNSNLTVDAANTAQQEQFYQFSFQLFYEIPSEEYIETVPLFDEQVGPAPGSSGAEAGTPASDEDADDADTGDPDLNGGAD